jgi:hypothetical protein
MMDPRAYLLNPLFCDPAALALLQQQPPFNAQHNGGGKMTHGSGASGGNNTSTTSTTTTSNSFRILDILESAARSNHSISSGGSDKANTSGENG